MSTPKKDDLETVRLIVDSLSGFSKDDQQRIFRWAAEKLAIPGAGDDLATTSRQPAAGPQTNQGVQPTHSGVADIKTFISQKKPRNDVQFAAAAAYFYRFEATAAERKDSINKEDLQEAARKANRERFANPHNTLSNAHKLGLLDKGSDKATFVINSVGENLVAMTLPDGAPISKPKTAAKQKKKSPGKAKKIAPTAKPKLAGRTKRV